MVVFDRKRLKPEWTVGKVPETVYGLSKSGWIDTERFELWFLKHFLAFAPSTHPLLLLLEVIQATTNQPSAAEKNLIVFCLPPNTTHLTRPLDKECVGPLKMFWHEECLKYTADHPYHVVTRCNFNQIFSKAWGKAMTMPNILTGFRVTGVYPLDRNVLRPKVQKKAMPGN